MINNYPYLPLLPLPDELEPVRQDVPFRFLTDGAEGRWVLYDRGAALRLFDSYALLPPDRLAGLPGDAIEINAQMDARAAALGGLPSVQWVH